jgi:hypothetical protein
VILAKVHRYLSLKYTYPQVKAEHKSTHRSLRSGLVRILMLSLVTEIRDEHESKSSCKYLKRSGSADPGIGFG